MATTSKENQMDALQLATGRQVIDAYQQACNALVYAESESLGCDTVPKEDPPRYSLVAVAAEYERRYGVSAPDPGDVSPSWSIYHAPLGWQWQTEARIPCLREGCGPTSRNRSPLVSRATAERMAMQRYGKSRDGRIYVESLVRI